MSNEFPIPKTGYLTFDALSMKQFLRDRLTANNVFPDANYEGSNIAAIIDIVAYMYNALLYYLNKTASESMFTDAQLYENMNRIVKLLDYNPIGKQTSVLPFIMSANSEIPMGLYIIPRYSYIQIGKIAYSFNEDIIISKTVEGEEKFTDLSNNKLLYQGKYIEYPTYTAQGQEFEIIYFSPGKNIKVDHFNIDVYVKRDNKWSQWKRVPSLFLNRSTDKVYECRLNENKNYVLKFGDNINGVKLNKGDQVAIYYLMSDGTDGEVGVHALFNKPLVKYSSIQFNDIISDINETNINLLDDSLYSSLIFDNNSISTHYNDEEDVESIRTNAPYTFRSQYRLVVTDDYKNYVKTNFSNIIHDVHVSNNWEYLSNQMKYYYDMGIKNPGDIASNIYAQIQFSDSCNFNNIYLTCVSKKLESFSTNESNLLYITPSQKELIINSINEKKSSNSEIIIMDPIYISIALCIKNENETIEDAVNKTRLFIVKDIYSRRNNNAIKLDVSNIIAKYFERTNCSLGQMIDIDYLTSKILSINGVDKFYTIRTDTNQKYEGLVLLLWNPIYINNDILQIQSNISLPYFKFPYMYDSNSFNNRIVINTEYKIYESVEY